MKVNKFIFLFFIAANFTLSIFHPESIIAQPAYVSKHDSMFYAVYPGMITTRFYFSQKYTKFTLPAPAGKKDLKYRPNTSVNMGVGATYHNFSLNLAYGFGFLNRDNEKGETKYLDLQCHFYPGKWAYDLYGQFYTGYYLHPKGYASDSPDNYYRRPDFVVNLFGLAAYRILNNKRFSYNAALIQNEWQKKSAGSFLYGGELYYGLIKADSAIVPSDVANGYPQAGINKISFFSFGPGVGYAYTLVVRQHFFVTGSLIINLNLGFSAETGVIHKNKTYVNPTSIFRLAAGYNSRSWNLSVNWIGNRLPARGASSSNNYLLQTGNFRIILSKKIMPGPKLKKRLVFLDRILK